MPLAISGLSLAVVGAVGLGIMLLALISMCFYGARRLRSKAQRHLAVAENAWLQAIEFSEDALCLIDLNDNLLHANQGYYEFLGKTPAEAIGRNVMRLVHGEHETESCPVCEARLARRDTVLTKEADDPFNRLRRPLEISIRVIRDRDGEAIGIFQVMRDLTRQRQAQSMLQDSQERFKILAGASFEGVLIHDQGLVVDANPAMARILGIGLDMMRGQHLLDLVDPNSRDLILRRLSSPTDEATRLYGYSRDGKLLHVEMRSRDFFYLGRHMRVVAVRDVTELEEARDALLEEKERLAVTLNALEEGVISADIQGRIQYINPSALRLTGWSEGAARKACLSEVFVIRDAHENPGSDPIQACLEAMGPIHALQDCTIMCRDQRVLALEYTAVPTRDRSGAINGIVLAFRDVGEMRRLGQQLTFHATHDALTGLINRREFERRLQAAHDSAKNDDRLHVLCYLDLDQFKVVNDNCGHVAGDALLRQIAALLAQRLRSLDSCARLGGDEFGLLLENYSLEQARRLAETIREMIASFRFVWEDKVFHVGVSIGIAAITAENSNIAETMNAADSACYMAKDQGRNRVYAYEANDSVLAKRHGEIQWVQRLTHAMDEGRLLLYCQRIQALSEPHPSSASYEILVRMKDEQGRIVPPMAFIPAAERYDLMPALDRWVISTALDTLRTLHRTRPQLGFALNISGRSLCDDSFQAFVLDAIQPLASICEYICFEITETAAIANFAQAQRFMLELKAQGCLFALDDFGSGFSSFAYLKNLPVDFVKIDGGFIRDLLSDPIDGAMVEAINGLGHLMGMRTIAECVENARILQRLRELNVDYVQGYEIDLPKPLCEVFEELKPVAESMPV